jgi:hypothetical protein
MSKINGRFQPFIVRIIRIRPCAEMRTSDIRGIRAGPEGRAKALIGTRGSKQLYK